VLSSRPTRAAVIAAAAAGSTLLLTAAPATALTAHPHGHTAPTHAPRPPKDHPKSQHFAAQGLVVSTTGSSMVVLAATVTTRGGVTRHTPITVTLPATRRPGGHDAAAAGIGVGLIVGDQVDLSGTKTGSGDTATFTATQVAARPRPAQLFLGTVTAISGTLLTLTSTASSSGGAADSAKSQGDSGDGSGTLTVDTATAAVTVDGAPGTVTIGQTVAVLGEGVQDSVLAASVTAFSTAPAVISGTVSDITATTVTVGDGDTATSVDLAGVPLVVNGNSGGTVTDLGVDTTLVVLGITDTAGVFTPTTAFGFTSADVNPVGDNPDD